MSALREDAAVPAGDVAVAALAWRFKGVVRVTAVAKATFAFVPDAAMTRIPAQPILRAEVHHGKHPARSIRLTPDLAPYLNRADVFLTGHAHAPRGSSPETMPVRLGIFNGAQAVLDKTVMVLQEGGIKQVPLTYERAYGGIGWTENPFGVGADKGSGAPNLINPRGEKLLAGFAPIGQALLARKRRLGGLPRQALEGAGIINLSDGIDWEYFQAAPNDQRIDFLRGDEWIVMEGLHPEHPRIRTALPGARGLGLVYGLGLWGVAEGHPLVLHADMLRIDTDAKHCTLTFRATFPVASEVALPSVRVVLGVALPDQPVRWPDPASFLPPEVAESPDSASIPLSSQDFEVEANVLEGTLRLEGRSDERRPDGDSATALLDNRALVAGTKAALTSTLSSVPADDAAEAAPALPFRGSVSPLHRPQPPADIPLRKAGDTLTRLFEEDETGAAQKPVLPFDPATPVPQSPAAHPDPPCPPAQPARLPAPAPPPAPAPLRATPAGSPAQARSFGAYFLVAIQSIEKSGDHA